MPWAARPRREPGRQEVGVMLKETLGSGDGPGEPDPKAGPSNPAASAPDAAPAPETGPAAEATPDTGGTGETADAEAASLADGTDGQASASHQPTTLRARFTGLPQLIGRHRLFSA